jgi:hypothetical protein
VVLIAAGRRGGPCSSSEDPRTRSQSQPTGAPTVTCARGRETEAAHDPRPPLLCPVAVRQYGVGTIVKLLKFSKGLENTAFLGHLYFNPFKSYKNQQQTSDIADACAITPGMVLLMVSWHVGKKFVYYWLSSSWFAGILRSSVANSLFW